MIDSINNFYRVESSSLEGLTNFAKLLVLLDSFNKSGAWIVSSAQVRYGEEGLPAYEFLYPWADIIINIEREGSFYRVLKFVKPKLDKVFCFGITLSGIRWTTTRI
uniref:KaiC-like domain-containing protein n=1 Tax=Ignisphaera aggregans TaxID=334771 RepID=A0A7C2VPN6_9CREN